MSESQVIDDVGPFALVPVWILELGLTGAELATYLALRSFANNSGECYPSQKTIAARAGISEIAVRKAVARFRDLGIVTTTPRYRPDGSLAGLTYCAPLVNPHLAGPIQQDTPPDTPVSDPRSAGYPHSVPPRIGQEEQTKEQTREHLSPDDAGEELTLLPPPPKPTDLFDEFWDAYAKKVGKGEARKKWDKALKQGADPLHLVAAARRYAACFGKGKENPRYQKHPATWLGQGCYDDEHLPEPVTLPRRGVIRSASGLVMDL